MWDDLVDEIAATVGVAVHRLDPAPIVGTPDQEGRLPSPVRPPVGLPADPSTRLWLVDEERGCPGWGGVVTEGDTGADTRARPRETAHEHGGTEEDGRAGFRCHDLCLRQDLGDGA